MNPAPRPDPDDTGFWVVALTLMVILAALGLVFFPESRT